MTMEINKVNRTRILIVDDEVHIRLLVSSLLGKDYTVLEASNGEEAINIARTSKPALILLDILMPKVDGYTACSVIKADQETKAIPVIMLTGVGHELNKKFTLEMGADGYLIKPFKLENLLDTINQFLKCPQEV